MEREDSTGLEGSVRVESFDEQMDATRMITPRAHSAQLLYRECFLM